MKKDKIKLVDITKIRFSPELEFELPAKRDAEKLIDRGKTLKGWEIKADYSLTNGIELSPENGNHLYYNEDSLLQIKEVLALVRVYRGKALPSCGLHIHVSATTMSDKDIIHIIKEWTQRQKFIVKRFNVSKIRLEETCKFLPKSITHKLTEKQIHEFRNKEGSHFRNYSSLDDKYHSMNLNNLPKGEYQTIEFRLFTATTNFKEIKQAIYFVLTFLQAALERE
jgi:hypothetical protein